MFGELTLPNPNFNAYYKSTVFKAMLYWQKTKYLGQWNKIVSRVQKETITFMGNRILA